MVTLEAKEQPVLTLLEEADELYSRGPESQEDELYYHDAALAHWRLAYVAALEMRRRTAFYTGHNECDIEGRAERLERCNVFRREIRPLTRLGDVCVYLMRQAGVEEPLWFVQMHTSHLDVVYETPYKEDALRRFHMMQAVADELQGVG